MALITCKDLVLSYEGQVVVEDLSFTVHAGDYLCIVGENGSGKSTLMKSILGLKTVNKGSITFGDQLKQNQIGYLPQQTTLQRDFPASVFEVTLSGCLNRRGWRPYYNRAEKYRAEDNLHRMGVAELKKKCYRELSGGQQQRVLLARALCATEKLLLAGRTGGRVGSHGYYGILQNHLFPKQGRDYHYYGQPRHPGGH